MGSLSNIGLTAKQAEEYGSHENILHILSDGVVKVINNQNKVLFSNIVKYGDI